MWHLIGLGPAFVLSPPFCASAAAATNRTAAPAFCGSSTHPPTRRSPTRLGTGTVVMAQPAAESAVAGADGAAPTPIVSAIHVYPVKSARPQPGLSHATVTAEGLAGDRRFLVTTVDGRYQTQREIPALATLEVGVVAGGDVLSLRRGAAAFNVTVRRDRVSARACSLFGDRVQLVDQGDDAGRWLGANLLSPGGGLGAALLPLLGVPSLRLVHAPDTVPRSRPNAGLSDAAPLLVICEESLAELNRRRAAQGKAPAPMARFRPNIVLSGCGAPHAEDAWKALRVGASAEFEVMGGCPRCTVPDVDQASGVRDAATAGPMVTLSGYRNRARAGVLFGIYVRPRAVGDSVRVGDAVAPRALPEDVTWGMP